MKYFLLFLFLTGTLLPMQAQNEKKITILPFRPPKKQTKRSYTPKKQTAPQKPPVSKNEKLDKDRMEKADTVDDYLKRNSQPMMAPSSSSTYTATVPGFVAGERSRYQKGETPSTMQHVPFKFEPNDKFEQDPRNRPVIPVGAGDVAPNSGGAAISGDINGALAKVFSKNARLRARNKKKRLWEKYTKATPNDSLVEKLNDKPVKMLSLEQQKDSIISRESVCSQKSSVPLRKDSVGVQRKEKVLRKGVNEL